MAFLELKIGNDMHLVNTEHIVDVHVSGNSIYFLMVNNGTFTLPYEDDYRAGRVFEELSITLKSEKFPSQSVYESRGLRDVG
jgi:hypothetical protein